MHEAISNRGPWCSYSLFDMVFYFFLRFYLIILPPYCFCNFFFYKHILLIETSFSWVPFVKILNKNLFAVYFDIREISFGHINDMHKKKWKVVKKEAIECRCHFTRKAQTKNNNNNNTYKRESKKMPRS